MVAVLKRVTIERQPDGRYVMIREHDGEDQDGKGKRGGGDRWTCDGVADCMAIVCRGYKNDGSPRPSLANIKVADDAAYEIGYVEGQNASLEDVQAALDQLDDGSITEADVVVRMRDLVQSG